MAYSRNGQIPQKHFQTCRDAESCHGDAQLQLVSKGFFFVFLFTGNKGVMSLFSAEGGMVPGTRMKIASFIRTA